MININQNYQGENKMSKYDVINKLVDLTLEGKKCPEGYRWCKFEKKCVPVGQPEKGTGRGLGRGQGKGPIGQPYNRQSELFAADFPEFTKVEKKVDTLIDSLISEYPDSEPNIIKSTPDEDSEELLQNIHGDIAGYQDPDNTENEYPPGPQDDEFEDDTQDGGIRSQLEFILKEEKYKEFFKSMMDKEGIKSPNDLSDDKKKEFFNKVDSMWKGKNESLQEKGEYFKFFKRMMNEEGVSSISQMSHDKKSSFFSKVSAKWKKEKGKSVSESFLNLI